MRTPPPPWTFEGTDVSAALMTVTDRLLFLHLHKSGGTFVNVMLMRCVRSARQLGYHLPYREVPTEYRGLPVIGTVRNPWAYYVSWYHFQLGLKKRNIVFEVCSDGGRLGFEGTVANLVQLSSDEERLAAIEEGLPDAYQTFGINLTKKDVGELRDRQLGFYSFLYERLYAGTTAAAIMPMERLREELRSMLTTVGELPNACIEQFLSEAPSLNVSSHDAPATYYGDELAVLVADRDRVVIDRYGYAF
jgi:hypothetical protein